MRKAEECNVVQRVALQSPDYKSAMLAADGDHIHAPAAVAAAAEEEEEEQEVVEGLLWADGVDDPVLDASFEFAAFDEERVARTTSTM